MRRISLLFALAALILALPGCVLDFSPDGKRVAFSWPGDNDKAVLAVMNVDGTGFATVPNSESGGFPLWSPDGKYVLFNTMPEGKDNCRLYTVADGKTKEIAQLSGTPCVWREDGKRFVNRSKKPGEGGFVTVYDVVDGGVTLRVRVAQDVNPMNVFWLPNTDDIAFAGKTDQGVDIYTIESGEVKKITTSGDVISLGLDKAHNRLIWARQSKNMGYILMPIYAFDLTSRSVARLPFPDRVPLINPDPRRAPDSIDYVTFSPDGTRVAIVASQPPKAGSKPDAPQHSVLYIASLDGKNVKLVREAVQANSLNMMSLIPIWAHDGKQVAVMDVQPAATVLWLYTPDGLTGRVIRKMTNK